MSIPFTLLLMVSMRKKQNFENPKIKSKSSKILKFTRKIRSIYVYFPSFFIFFKFRFSPAYMPSMQPTDAPPLPWQPYFHFILTKFNCFDVKFLIMSNTKIKNKNTGPQSAHGPGPAYHPEQQWSQWS